MTTITLDDSAAQALSEQAAAAGLSVQDYLRKHVAGGNGHESHSPLRRSGGMLR
ncbi:MAG TPA: hypothetical protein VNT79_10430 [Phycisphaerae bacterium]|nr:hypothetical protein [Phycisphaerae bacterium]